MGLEHRRETKIANASDEDASLASRLAPNGAPAIVSSIQKPARSLKVAWPLWALLVSVVAFIVLGSIRASRVREGSRALDARPVIDVWSLIAPEFKNSPRDKKGEGAYLAILEEAKKATSEAPGSESFNRLVSATGAPSIAAIGNDAAARQAAEVLYRPCSFPEVSSAIALRSYRALLTLYPKIEANKASRSLEMIRAVSDYGPWSVRSLRSHNLKATDLEALLRAMPEDIEFNAEAGYIRSVVGEILPNALQPFASGTEKRRRSELVDVPQTMALGQRVGQAMISDLHRTWRDYGNKPRGMEILSAAKLANSEGSEPNGFLNKHQQSNDTGVMILSQEMVPAAAAIREAFLRLTNYRACRTIVGIAIYEKRHGRMPESLNALVEDGIFTSLPVDPYSDQPFHYLKDAHALYSTGEDVTDNGSMLNADLVFYLDPA